MSWLSGDDRVATGGEDCGVTGVDGVATGVVVVATGTKGLGW